MPLHLLNENVDMGRHDAPRKQPIALTIEMQHRVLNNLGENRIA